uniref:Uncharacterized protein n=1 Tax=Sphaerodactylus townsendi TaxID=933632 RepID=A0ACB8EL64_9SAUR
MRGASSIALKRPPPPPGKAKKGARKTEKLIAETDDEPLQGRLLVVLAALASHRGRKERRRRLLLLDASPAYGDAGHIRAFPPSAAGADAAAGALTRIQPDSISGCSAAHPIPVREGCGERSAGLPRGHVQPRGPKERARQAAPDRRNEEMIRKAAYKETPAFRA